MSLRDLKRLELGAVGIGGSRIERGAIRSLSQLDVVRAQALGGDERSRQLFGRYGVGGSLLSSGTSLEIAEAIRRSIGNTPISKHAANLRQIFGQSYQATMALMAQLDSLSQAADLFRRFGFRHFGSVKPFAPDSCKPGCRGFDSSVWLGKRLRPAQAEKPLSLTEGNEGNEDLACSSLPSVTRQVFHLLVLDGGRQRRNFEPAGAGNGARLLPVMVTSCLAPPLFSFRKSAAKLRC